MTAEEQIAATVERLANLDLDDTWLDASLWDEVGPKLTCREAEALGLLMILAGHDIHEVATLIVLYHGAGDNRDGEPDDWHKHEEE